MRSDRETVTEVVPETNTIHIMKQSSIHATGLASRLSFPLRCILLLLLTNRTVDGGHSYLYPLIPFNGRALLSLFVRLKKSTKPRKSVWGRE